MTDAGRATDDESVVDPTAAEHDEPVTGPTTGPTTGTAADDGDEPVLDPEELHVPDEVSLALKRFVLINAVLRLGVPIVTFFTIVAPLVASIVDGETSNIYWLTLIRPSKDSLLWGGALWRTRPGEVDLLLLFAAYAPLMIVMNWPFLYLGRAYGPALARGDGPAWLQRTVSPENLAMARTLLARKGPTIAILGRIAALPPTVMAAAAGTSDVQAWRYQLADTVGGVLGFGVTVGIGVALGEAWERAGVWTTVASVALVFLAVMWMTRWLQREAERDPELAAVTDEP